MPFLRLRPFQCFDQTPELALRLEPLIAAKAKEKQVEGGKQKVPQKSAEAPIEARKELAAIAELALRLEPLIAAKAKEKQGARNDIAPTLAKNVDTRKSIAAIAELALRLEPLIAAKAKERMVAGRPVDPDQNSGQGKTDKSVAAIAELALRLEPLIAAKAAEQKREAGRQAALEQHGRVSQKSVEPTPMDTQKSAATFTSPRSTAC